MDSPFVLKFNPALGFTVIRSPAPTFIDQELQVLSSILFVWPVEEQRKRMAKWGRERRSPPSD